MLKRTNSSKSENIPVCRKSMTFMRTQSIFLVSWAMRIYKVIYKVPCNFYLIYDRGQIFYSQYFLKYFLKHLTVWLCSNFDKICLVVKKRHFNLFFNEKWTDISWWNCYTSVSLILSLVSKSSLYCSAFNYLM